jgi:PadR family transcriptional regulator, regulatory protein PadR
MADTQMRKGALELAVLILVGQRPRYGVELLADLAARPGLAATGGTVYPLLTRLKNSGLIDATWEESPKGPPRKYYRITPSGREALREQTAAWTTLSAAMTDLLGAVR